VTTFFTTIGIVAGALISLGVLLSPFYKKIKRWAQWMDRFMRDWEGEPAEPGRDAVPGVMERINKLDGELSNNGGKSTKDVVDKLLANQGVLMEAFVEMGERLIAIENCLTITLQDEKN
jgi:hypothetical protein